MDDAELRAAIAAFKPWYHRIEIRPGIVTPGTNDSSRMLARLNVPIDCAGLRVLDIGTRDGFFAFELEKRGADVVAIDHVPATASGFDLAARLLGSKVRYVQDNLYNLSPDSYGHFDVVLFLGVLYHLPDPLGALHLVRRVSRARLYLETHVIDAGLLLPDGEMRPLASLSPLLEAIPLMRLYPGSSLNRDITNFWGPNSACVEQMLEDSAFQVIARRGYGDRAIFECRVAPDTLKARHFRRARGWSGAEV